MTLHMQYLSQSSGFAQKLTFLHYRKKKKKKCIKSLFFSSYCWFLPADWPGIISCATLFPREGKTLSCSQRLFPFFRAMNTWGQATGKIITAHNELHRKEDEEENHIFRNSDISSEPFRKKRQHRESAYLLWFTSSLTVRRY